MSTETRVKTFLVLIFLLSHATVFSQFLDSLQISTGATATMASRDYQPLWMVSNRFGTIEDLKADLSSHLAIYNKNNLPIKMKFGSGKVTPYIQYGANVTYNQHFKNVVFQQAFIKLSINDWEIRAGRYQQIVGENNNGLSSGSLGVSGNSLPVPQIEFALNDYKPVPFTDDFFQFKGSFSHGWMGKNQFMKDAYLHQKTFYGRIGKNKLKVFGGIQHFAVWGGRRDDWTTLDRSWNGFLNVVLLKEADDGSVDFGLPRDSLIHPPNKAGDHRGVVELGFEWANDKVGFKVYHQTPFDKRQGISTKNVDKLLGISISNKKPNQLVQSLLVEFIHTKQMVDYVSRDIRESYYNNGVYRTGWEYEGKIIGTPLMINRLRANKYYEEIVPYDWDAPMNASSGNSNIVSNRMVGGHFGCKLFFSTSLSSRTLLTYVQHYPGFSNRGPFAPVKKQAYTLQELLFKFKRNVFLKGGLAYDFGELSRNAGMMFGLEWNIKQSAFSN